MCSFFFLFSFSFFFFFSFFFILLGRFYSSKDEFLGFFDKHNTHTTERGRKDKDREIWKETKTWVTSCMICFCYEIKQDAGVRVVLQLAPRASRVGRHIGSHRTV